MTAPKPTAGTVPYSSPQSWPNNPQSGAATAMNALMLLLDGETAANTGAWVQAFPFSRGFLETTITSNPTVSIELRGSNALQEPADSDDGHIIGSAISAAGFTSVTSLPRWIKAKLVTLSGGTNPTVSCALNAFAP